MQNIGSFLLALLGLTLAGHAAEVIHLGIGTQDTTINCAAGGPVIRELHLLDKYLPHDGKYKDATYNIHWVNLPTGAQLNNEVLAGRLDIVSMADFPSILGYDALLSKNDGVKTLYIASLSLGLRGAGNALLVPLNSTVQSIADLKGKTISVPFASTAHAFLLRAVQNQGWDPSKDVRIVTQAPEIGGSALKSGQIDAHADFVPFGELFPFRGFARKILDGESTGVTTTHGIQVRSDFAQKYPEVVIAYLRAALEGERLIRENPESIAEQYQKWTGIEAEVFYAFHGPQGIQTRDYTLKPEVIAALVDAARTFLLGLRPGRHFGGADWNWGGPFPPARGHAPHPSGNSPADPGRGLDTIVHSHVRHGRTKYDLHLLYRSILSGPAEHDSRGQRD
jgi:NitT/TauT family transport system substrate-binding protein